MSNPKQIRMPKYPECWSSCGACASGERFIQSVLMSPGERVRRDDTVVVLETGKVALDIPSPWDGVIVEVYVEENDPIDEGDLLALIDADD